MSEVSNIKVNILPLGPQAKGLEKAGVGLGPSFKETLNESLNKTAPVKEPMLAKTLSFSNHAVERMSQRGMHFSPEQMTQIEGAVNKAASKGSKESLVISNDSALIVDVKNRKVVTVMDKNMLKENVFTNIDSTVFI